MNTSTHMVALPDDMDSELTSYPVRHLSTQISAEPGYVVKVFVRLAAENQDGGEIPRVVRGYN
ncbi:hypothetical protein [Paraburkholderia aspalathi]|uniref:Uncharacterized protein n=1 Tax=Paraburkholderia aspalathi TaxID=1324617 RepID=A0A1I7ELS0_9BURK|nr:hypothetical protein [Paraburkholderia aspalathi]SFU24880.1 hypothetical protein SAMN05192563_103076 [Paraburkholderia aspalathi]